MQKKIRIKKKLTEKKYREKLRKQKKEGNIRKGKKFNIIKRCLHISYAGIYKES